LYSQVVHWASHVCNMRQAQMILQGPRVITRTHACPGNEGVSVMWEGGRREETKKRNKVSVG
jgi:hypothetical protein